MKALFTTFPAYGHLLPMLPLARAAVAAGDEVVVVAAEELHATADDLTMRALGPSFSELPAAHVDALDRTVALFTTARADLAFDELCETVRYERPDVIVAEMRDYVAPLVAQRLGIPWVTFVHSPAAGVDAVLEAGLASAAEQHQLPVPVRTATVELWPAWLESEQIPAHQETALPMAADAYNTSTVVDIPAFAGTRPVVLVTLGTVVEDIALLNAAVRGVLDAGADALVTTGLTLGPEGIEGDSDRIRAVRFAPIGQLLDRVQAVVTTGGPGTALAALSRGLPLAFLPSDANHQGNANHPRIASYTGIANHQLVASAVAGFDAGVVCDDPTKLTAALERVLHDAELRARARAAAEWLARRPAPDVVWSLLRDRLAESGR
ncbi:glycosyltransferase [Streptomyces sp. NPDC088794]|uniref:glycosyltransferase n=1 Tax=Streptomyces sp. NPDC088794 TaxID=3365902 RepID=UPI0037F1595D